MGDWRWLVWLIGLAVLLRLAPVLMLLPTLMRMRLRPYRSRAVAPESLEPEVVAWLREAARPLVELGFREQGFARIRDLMDSGADDEVHLFLQEPETGTLADLMPPQLPDHRLPWRIDLDSHLADGQTLTTVNALGYAILETHPTQLVNDVYCPTERALWEAHRDALAKLGPTARPDIHDRLRRGEALGGEVLRHYEARSLIRREPGEESYRLRPLALLRFAWRMGTGARRRERFLRERAAAIAAGTLPDCDVPLWQELEACLRTRRSLRRPLDGTQRVALLVGSGLAFGVTMAAIFGAVAAACLVAVIAFHELGHYAAMRAFGYRDTSVFFLPFLGAATTGRKPDATLAQEMIVLLAGPLPGIALGVALAGAAPEATAAGTGRVLVLMLVIINAFNLLPVLPLDGGKVVDRLTFGGRPWLALAIGGLGVAGLAGLAAGTGDWILLAFAALFALAVRGRFQTLRILQRLPVPDLRHAGEEERVRTALALLAREPRMPYATKLGWVRTLESHGMQVPASRAARAAWLLAYAVLVAAGAGGVGVAVLALRQSST